MARFLLTHEVLLSAQDQAVDGLRQLAESLPDGLVWVNSWWIPDLGQMVCEWEGPDLKAIMDALAPFHDTAPVVASHEVERIDPHWYD